MVKLQEQLKSVTINVIPKPNSGKEGGQVSHDLLGTKLR